VIPEDPDYRRYGESAPTLNGRDSLFGNPGLAGPSFTIGTRDGAVFDPRSAGIVYVADDGGTVLAQDKSFPSLSVNSRECLDFEDGWLLIPLPRKNIVEDRSRNKL
jgi:hypothetical protein